MANAPYGVRLLVGAAATVIEETRKLPQTILMYPMTIMSQAAHLVMRFQQNLADLAIKGDETIETLFPPKDEQPEWATFDEDLTDEPPETQAGDGERERVTEGRFALYSTPDAVTERLPIPAANTEASDAKTVALADTPEIAVELDYDALTLAQLRARLQSLGVTELEALLAYEVATKARAPFQTLLANRITRASAK